MPGRPVIRGVHAPRDGSSLHDAAPITHMLDTLNECLLAGTGSFALLLAFQKVVDWPNLGTGFKILWLFNYPAGGAPCAHLAVQRGHSSVQTWDRDAPYDGTYAALCHCRASLFTAVH